MKVDLDSILATLGSQTVVGVLSGNWVAGACAAIGLLMGLLISRCPEKWRQIILPIVLAGTWAYFGPKAFA